MLKKLVLAVGVALTLTAQPNVDPQKFISEDSAMAGN
jgi:hypothetical protein